MGKPGLELSRTPVLEQTAEVLGQMRTEEWCISLAHFEEAQVRFRDLTVTRDSIGLPAILHSHPRLGKRGGIEVVLPCTGRCLWIEPKEQ